MSSLWDIASKTSSYNTSLEEPLLENKKNKEIEFITNNNYLDQEIKYNEEASVDICSKIKKINSCFTEVSKLVNAQGITINDIENNIDDSHKYTENGVKQIDKAIKHQKQTYRYCSIFLLIIVSIFLIIIIIVLLYYKYF